MSITFRADILRLKDEGFPTKNIVNGFTCYFVDTKEFFIFYNGEWYPQNSNSEEV